MGSMPCWRCSIFSGMISTQVTRLPKSAKQVPVTSPTYPVPMTQMVDKSITPLRRAGTSHRPYRWARGGDKPPPLQVGIHEGIFVFFFTNGCGFAMSWEYDQVFVKRVELFANRCDDLLKVPALEIGAANAA